MPDIAQTGASLVVSRTGLRQHRVGELPPPIGYQTNPPTLGGHRHCRGNKRELIRLAIAKLEVMRGAALVTRADFYRHDEIAPFVATQSSDHPKRALPVLSGPALAPPGTDSAVFLTDGSGGGFLAAVKRS